MSQECFSLSFLWIPCIRAGPPLSPSFHPHSWLSDFRSVHGGCSQFSRCCYLIIDLGSCLSTEAGPGVGRSHLISAVELGCLDTISLLSFVALLFFFLPAFPSFPQRNFAPGSPKNDDRRLRRPLASPFLWGALHSRPRRASLCGYCAVVRTPLHSPTTDAAVPLTFVLRQRRLVSWHSFLLVPLVSIPSAADHCPVQRARECSVRLAPSASLNRRHLPC